MHIDKANLSVNIDCFGSDLLFSILTSDYTFSSHRLLSKPVSNKDLSLWMLSNELTSELNNDN